MLNDKITHENRITMHVGSTHVQCPGNIIQGRHQHAVTVLSAQDLTYSVEFRGCSFTGKLKRLQFNFMLWNGRSVIPNASQWVEIEPQSHASLVAQFGFQGFCLSITAHCSVNTHLASCLALLSNPFCNGRRSVYFEPHKLVF